MIKLTTEDIIIHCGEWSYKKGQDCASSDYFIKLFVQENILFGVYQGTLGMYRISLIFNSDALEYAWCTCPAMGQYEGNCKHIAGLMILWNEQPHAFMPLSSWHNLFADKDPKELLKRVLSAASKSIDMTSALYQEFAGEALIDYEALCEPDYNHDDDSNAVDEW